MRRPSASSKAAMSTYSRSLFQIACFNFDESQDDSAVTLAGHAHGPHAVHHRRLDFDEALASIALHGPPCRALGRRRGDGVMGCISASAEREHEFCRRIEIANAVVAPIDPKAKPTLIILHVV
jgi:hypothetical protein